MKVIQSSSVGAMICQGSSATDPIKMLVYDDSRCRSRCHSIS